jgi:tetratricopeptide (TPR) repeat protein
MESRNEKLQDLIDRYFEGQLSEKDQLEFKEKMNDPSFRSAVKFQQKLASGLKKDYQNSRLKGLFQAEEKKMAKRVFLRQRLSIAASILVLLVAGWYVFSGPPTEGPVTSNELDIESVLALHKSPGDTGKKGGADEGTEANPNEACKILYEPEEAFQKALDCFLTLQNNGEGDLETTYYIGSCHFKLGNYPQALEEFEQAAADGQSVFKPATLSQIEWNILVAKVLTADNPTAYLDEVSSKLKDPEYDYYQEAQKLSNLISATKQ